MTTENHLKTIISHLEELQEHVDSLQLSAVELEASYVPEKSAANADIDHDEIRTSVNEIANIMNANMAQTEQLVKASLHPDRIDQLTNFMKVMQQTLDSMEK